MWPVAIRPDPGAGRQHHPSAPRNESAVGARLASWPASVPWSVTLTLRAQSVQSKAGTLGQRERTAGHRMLECRGQMSGGHFDNRTAPRAHRVMVRVVSEAVGGDPALDG